MFSRNLFKASNTLEFALEWTLFGKTMAADNLGSPNRPGRYAPRQPNLPIGSSTDLPDEVVVGNFRFEIRRIRTGMGRHPRDPPFTSRGSLPVVIWKTFAQAVNRNGLRIASRAKQR